MGCARCGAASRPGARFCDSCGRELAPVGEATRKVVTVLFSDLTGSTALGERMDPESVRELMSSFFAVMRAEVEERGGSVRKFTGDGLMAVFGVPDLREDDATRAVAAGIGMVRASAGITDEHDIHVKVGINTGEVVFGAGDADIVGDCVNVAARLADAAEPGDVIVGAETWRLTRSGTLYEPVAPLDLKGKSEPVAAYRVIADHPVPEPASTIFVGRDAELDLLIGAFDHVVDDRAMHLSTVIGAPGLGKTRLTRELRSAVADRALVVETRCEATETATFAPIAETLRTITGIDDSSDADAVVGSVLSVLPADDPERDRIAVRVAALLGVGEPASTEETFWAIRRLVEAAAQHRPLVLVLDDAHWAEPLLLDLVEHLAVWTRTAPVHLVVTARPELREVRPALTVAGRATDVISLEGLDERATAALACGLLGSDHVPTELLGRLPSETEGNPLYVREFVRMLVDDGVLQRTNGAWVATIDVDSIDVPPTIQSLLAARIERLSAPERTVLELASVIGKEFFRGTLDALLPDELRDDVDRHLEGLRRKELIEHSEVVWWDEPVVRFHHNLIRDAAYRRLLKEARAELHERVADWFHRTGVEMVTHDRDELIGYHLEQAHVSLVELGRRDAHTRELAHRAGSLLGRAARSALDRDDLPAAAVLSARALHLLDDPEDRVDVAIVRCESLLGTGNVSSGASAVHDLEQLATTPRVDAWVGCFAGELANLTGAASPDETDARVSTAARRFAELGDDAGAAKAHTVHAATLTRLGRVGEAEEALDRALSAARRADDRRRMTAVLDAVPVAAVWGPSPVSRAGGRCLDVMRLLRITTGSPSVEATSLRCQALLEALRGRADAARRLIGASRHMLEELGLRHGLLETELFAGMVELVSGNAAQAAGHLRIAHEGFVAMGVDVGAARAAAILARALLVLGDEDDADALASASERLSGHDLVSTVTWRSVRSYLLARSGDKQRALEIAQTAVDLASSTDSLLAHADACRALAIVCRIVGEDNRGRLAAQRAAFLYEEKGAAALLKDVEMEPAPPEYQPRPDEIRGIHDNTCASATRHATELFGNEDWVALAQCFSPDSVWADNRPGLRSEHFGRGSIVANLRTMHQIGAKHMDMTLLDARGDRLALFRAVVSGDIDGAFVAEDLTLAMIDTDGLIVRTSIYEPDALVEATAELERLDEELETKPEPAGVRLSNRCTDVFAAVLDAFGRREWDELGALYAEDFFVESRRPGLLHEAEGRSGSVEGWVAAADVGATRCTSKVVATRGERLALTHVWFGGEDDTADAFATDVLFLNELDDNGSIVGAILYDDSDREAAFHELDQRFVDGEGARYATVWRIFVENSEALAARDWDRYKVVLDNDVSYVDHRLANMGAVKGPDDFVTYLRAFTDVLPDLVMRAVSIEAIDEGRAVFLAEVTGTNSEGGPIEFTSYVVARARNGRATHVEEFPLDAREAVLARFEEFAS